MPIHTYTLKHTHVHTLSPEWEGTALYCKRIHNHYKQEQTLLMMVSNSTKLIHQRLDKLEADIIDIIEKLKETVENVDELKQRLQMYEDTNDKILVEIDNSIKQQKIECIAQVEDIQQVNNEWKEKLRNLEGRSRRDNLPIDGILEYEEESWDETKELLKDALREKLGEIRFKLKEPIKMEQKKEVKTEL